MFGFTLNAIEWTIIGFALFATVILAPLLFQRVVAGVKVADGAVSSIGLKKISRLLKSYKWVIICIVLMMTGWLVYKTTGDRYMGTPTGGTYVLNWYSWLIFHWEDGTCIAIADRDSSFIEKKLDKVDEYWVLSRKGSELIRVKTLKQGQTWEGMTCKK